MKYTVLGMLCVVSALKGVARFSPSISEPVVLDFSNKVSGTGGHILSA